MTIGAEDADQALIAAAQRGERSALDDFVRRHDGWVRHVVYATVGEPSMVDDVVQKVWINVWQQIGSLVEPERWRGWLYRLARNAAIDEGLRQSREKQRRRPWPVVRDSSDAAPDPAQALAADEECRRLLDKIKALPPIYREPFMLRHLEGWSYAEIGEAMSLPVETVETRLVRARRLLRDALVPPGPSQKGAHERP